MNTAKEILERALDEDDAIGVEDVDARRSRRRAIREALAALRGPEPDWSEAPEWAEWWAVGSNNDARWFTKEPVVASFAGSSLHWFSAYAGKDAGHVLLPHGCDWRLTLRKRPEASE